jgi:hypothetical protein
MSKDLTSPYYPFVLTEPDELMLATIDHFGPIPMLGCLAGYVAAMRFPSREEARGPLVETLRRAADTLDGLYREWEAMRDAEEEELLQVVAETLADLYRELEARSDKEETP